MAAVLREERYGVPTWAWALTGVGSVLGGGYLLYLYFIKPGEDILRNYEEILGDIYKETKEFLLENAALPEPIYGLTALQEEIIKAKEDAAERIRPLVEEVVTGRGMDVWDVALKLGTLAVVLYAAPHLVEKLIDLLKKWRTEQPEASATIQSSYGHSALVLQLLENELALDGRLNIASGFQATMQSHYAVYTYPALSMGIAHYTTLIPTLTVGSMAWIVATHMLTYMTYEASVTTGLMGLMWTFWIPPLI